MSLAPPGGSVADGSRIGRRRVATHALSETQSVDCSQLCLAGRGTTRMRRAQKWHMEYSSVRAQARSTRCPCMGFWRIDARTVPDGALFVLSAGLTAELPRDLRAERVAPIASCPPRRRRKLAPSHCAGIGTASVALLARKAYACACCSGPRPRKGVRKRTGWSAPFPRAARFAAEAIDPLWAF